MRTQKQKRYVAGLATAALITGCLGIGGGEGAFSDLRAAAAPSEQLQMGDVNFDGYVDADDAGNILSYYLLQMIDEKGGTFDSLQLTLADVDHNGVVDADDTGKILERYVSLLTGIPYEWEIYSETYPAGRGPNAAVIIERTVSFGGLSLTLGADTDTADAKLGQPADILTEQHRNGALSYRIYHPAQKDFTIVMADGETIVGAYVLTNQWSYQTSTKPIISKESSDFTWMEYAYENELTITECHDFRGGTGVYAVQAMQSGYSADFSDLRDMSDLSVSSRLCWYVTNGLRARHGAKPLYWHDGVSECARKHAQDMATNQFFDHVGSNGSTLSDRLAPLNLGWCMIAENIEVGYPSVFLAVDGWYNSDQGHREALLKASYTGIGIGFVSEPGGRWVYGTQDFFTLFSDL